MQTRSLRISVIALLVGASLSAATASAQMNPEGGDVWVPPPDDTGSAPAGNNGGAQQQQQQQPQGQAWYQGGPTGTSEPAERPPNVSASSNAAAPSSQGSSQSGAPDDHMRVVGHLAVGYMGTTNVPIGSLGVGSPGATPDTVTAPAIGIRYWFSELVGLDLGLGLGVIGGSTTRGTDSAPTNSAFAGLIHGGAPIAIYHQSHYKFLIIPEVNLGFSSGTAYGAQPDQDQGRNGLLFQVGGRLGTEIHFGFMDVPQLSLQASVGIYFNYASAGVGSNRAGTAQPEGNNSYSFATTVMGQPWDIFLGSLTALYYF